MNAHSFSGVRLSVGERIAQVVLEHAPANAIGSQWLAAWDGVLEELARRDDWHVLHVRSLLSIFCAGADLAEMRARWAAPDGVDEMVATAAAMQRLFARLEALPQVTIAEIGGAALGGGFELALACDLRIAAHEARVGLPEARLGLVPGAGGTQRLTRMVGPAIARRLILGGEVLDGATALELGLVQWAVPRAELAARAAGIAAQIAALPAEALGACKACIAAAGDPARDGYAEELAQSRRLYQNETTRQRVSAFLAKRSST